MTTASKTLVSACILGAAGFMASAWGQSDRQLVGKSITDAPYLFPVQALHIGDSVQVVFAPQDISAGTTVDIYLIYDRSAEDWQNNTELEDVRFQGPQAWTAGASLDENAVVLANTEALSTTIGNRPGRGYDLVIDVDQNGQLGPGDLIDGREDVGIFLLGNWGEQGPHPIAVFEHTVSFWETMRIHHPTDWNGEQLVPLVVISHGWTHEYTYYDDLASYMASHGYVVLSHRNDVGNGGATATSTASQTALENIDAFLNDVETMGGGVLAGHVDMHRIVHAGHSTGGECVVRAHLRLTEGDYISPYVQAEDFVLLQGLAPVAFLEANMASPLQAPYHHIFPAADTDVTGNASDGYVQGMAIFERGTGPKYATFIHGSGHNDLHDNPGPSLASGPSLIGKEATHDVLKPLFLALAEWHAWDNPAGLDYFRRNRSTFRPLCIGDSVVLSGEMREKLNQLNMLDDFETAPDLNVSSSGAAVSFSNIELHEVTMSDTDESFEFTGDNWANGMCRARLNDQPRCATMAWETDGEWCIEFDPVADWSESQSFNFRAAALTRHPLNESSDLFFEVEIEDATGQTAVLPSSWWGGVSAPYPRSGGGAYSICLPSGYYTLNIGGSTWPEEQLVTIPGVLTEVGMGSTGFQWEAASECDTLQILCYDTYGDGWDSGTFTLENEAGDIVLIGTLNSGFDPDLGTGWQNEFHALSFPLSLLTLINPELDASMLARACIRVGPSSGSPQGAMALDDVHVTPFQSASSVVSLPASRPALRLSPNPASGLVQINIDGVQEPACVSVRSLTGEVMWSSSFIGSEFRLDTSTWNAGLYLVVAEVDGIHRTQKLVVQRGW